MAYIKALLVSHSSDDPTTCFPLLLDCGRGRGTGRHCCGHGGAKLLDDRLSTITCGILFNAKNQIFGRPILDFLAVTGPAGAWMVAGMAASAMSPVACACNQHRCNPGSSSCGLGDNDPQLKPVRSAAGLLDCAGWFVVATAGGRAGLVAPDSLPPEKAAVLAPPPCLLARPAASDAIVLGNACNRHRCQSRRRQLWTGR
jgi:hypothetical protein